MRYLFVTLTLIFSPILVAADTLTLKDNSSVNGIVRYTAETFELKGVFKEEGKTVSRTYHLKREYVKAIRLNDLTLNPGPPPSGIREYATTDTFESLAEKVGTKRISSASATSVGNDVVRLKNFSSKEGKLILMDLEKITLDKDNSFKRDEVLSITIGHP